VGWCSNQNSKEMRQVHAISVSLNCVCSWYYRSMVASQCFGSFVCYTAWTCSSTIRWFTRDINDNCIKLYVRSAVNAVCCSCKGGWKRNQCTCKKNQVFCSAKCHKNTSCCNNMENLKKCCLISLYLNKFSLR